MNSRKKKQNQNVQKKLNKDEIYKSDVRPWDPEWQPKSLSQSWIKGAWMKKMKEQGSLQ
jgi:hypothetical protein